MRSIRRIATIDRSLRSPGGILSPGSDLRETPEVTLPAQAKHAVLPRASHDDAARQAFVETMGRTVLPTLATLNRAAYGKVGNASMDRHRLRRTLSDHPAWQLSSALRLVHQEALWDSVIGSVERQLPNLVAAADRLRATQRHATLRLDPSLDVPRYLAAVDIHLMPGNYDGERIEDDISAGALYDRGVFIRALGLRGAYGEDYGASFGDFVRARFPDLAVRRVLEIGCAVGGSTLGLVEAFPEAQVHAIDVAAPVLRYAQARMESLGRRAHFEQQNAERLSFDDDTFDVVAGFALLHETSAKALPRILREVHRVLRPGRVAIFRERPAFSTLTPLEAHEIDWDTYYNGEPFYGQFFSLDRRQIFLDAGFRPDRIISDAVQSHEHGGRQGVAYPGFGAWK